MCGSLEALRMILPFLKSLQGRTNGEDAHHARES